MDGIYHVLVYTRHTGCVTGTGIPNLKTVLTRNRGSRCYEICLEKGIPLAAQITIDLAVFLG